MRPNPRRRPPPRRQPTKEYLVELLSRANIVLSRVQVDQLWRYHGLLRDNNHDRDLTRIVGFENIVIKHYVDCMCVGQLVDLPSPILDIGTGAGFPGIPLKIRYPHLDIVLAEPRPRRVAFLENVIAALGLRKARVFPHRVVSRSFTDPVAAVITRALEPIGKTMLRSSACTRAGTRYIFLKGPAVEPEIDEAKQRFGAAIRLIGVKKYTLPGTPHERRLVVFERTSANPLGEGEDEDEVAAGEEEAS